MSSQKTNRSTRRLSDVARHVCVPSGIETTAWPGVEARASEMGIFFDDWQAQLGALMLAKRHTGKYAAGVGGACISIPRQAGKTYLVGWTVFALCSLHAGMTVIWTAHHTRTTNETFDSMRSMASKPQASGLVASVRATNGQQAIEFTNGSRILFGARESGFGRGFAMVDVLVFDEAQILTENAMSDMVPATNAAPNGLVLMMGTPPRPKDPGEAFSVRREAALKGDPDTMFVEFSADDDVDPASWGGLVDFAQVEKANPSFPVRTSGEAVRRLYSALSPDSFRREALGVWDVESDAHALPVDVWDTLQVPDDTPLAGSLCFGVKFALDGSHVALAVASKLEAGGCVVDAVRVAEASEGIAWLVDFLADPDRRKRTAQIVVEGKAGTGYLLDRLRAERVPKRVIIKPTMDQAITAHAMLLDAVKQATVHHYGQTELTRQVGTVSRRKIGSQGGFGWQAPDGDTCALLDAVTIAFWAQMTTKRRPGATKGVIL